MLSLSLISSFLRPGDHIDLGTPFPAPGHKYEGSQNHSTVFNTKISSSSFKFDGGVESTM